MLNALEDWLSPPQVLIVRGAADAAQDWTRQIGACYAPRRMLFAIPDSAQLPPALAEKRAMERTVAYLCSGTTCSAPLTDLPSIVRQLQLRISAAPRGTAIPAANDP
jgi:uncharacterized protein YyaL (SSP411 family)